MNDPNRLSWLEQRKQTLGASDIAKIFDGKGLQVWQDKVGLAEQREMTRAQKLGLRNEAGIAETWAEENGYDLMKGEYLRDPQIPILSCTPDYLLKRKGEIVGILEIKHMDPDSRFLRHPVTEKLIWGEERSDQAPTPYVSQCLFQRPIVCSFHMIAIPVVFLVPHFGGDDMRTYEIPANPDLESGLREYGVDWWTRCVEANVPPPCDDTVQVEKYLKQRYPTHGPQIIQCADEMQEQLLAEGLRLYGERKSAEDAYDAVKVQIQEIIGDNAGISGAAGGFTWKQVQTKPKDDPEAVIERLIEEFNLDRVRVSQINVECRKTAAGYRRMLPRPAK